MKMLPNIHQCCLYLISSTKELFLKFLERLEKDYNPEEYEGNLIKDVSIFLNNNRMVVVVNCTRLQLASTNSLVKSPTQYCKAPVGMSLLLVVIAVGSNHD